MNFKNLSLAKKLGIGFGAVLFIITVSSVLVLKQTRDLAEIERLNSVSDSAVDLIDQLRADLAEQRAAGYRVVISGDKADIATSHEDYAKYRKDFAALKGLIDQDAPQFIAKLLAADKAVAAYFDDFLAHQTALAVDPATHQQAVAGILSAASVSARKAFVGAFESLRDDVGLWSNDLNIRSRRSMAMTVWIVAVSGAVCVMVGLFMAWFVARLIGRPLNLMTSTMRALAGGDNRVEVPALDQTDEIGQMAGAVQVFKTAAIEKIRLEAEAATARQAAQAERDRAEADRAVAAKQQAQVVDQIAGGLNKLAAGDLLYHIDQPFAPEYEGLRGDFNAAVVQLQKTIKELFTSTGAISSGTGEISTASDDLSRRTEQQAASLEETAAALTEITAAMKRTAEGAIHARKVVGSAQLTVGQSNDVIAQTITAMGNIEKASNQISQIIGVIDEIAFQTNLLALNAGVEAARAGEAGRGFAVVASEVRGLAQRCAEAAKEVKALVRSSEEQVKSGVELVGNSGTMLAKIVSQVAELTAIVNDIAGSAETQSVGLSEVNLAIRQMDQVTQQNAAMAEEATAAAHNLAHESVELVRLIGRFNVGAEARAPTARSAAPAAAARPPVKKVAASSGGARPQPASGSDDWAEF